MGMGSPDNRRKADGSYRTLGVGGALCPVVAMEANMAGLPLSLVIAIWLVGAMWIVGLTARFFGFSSDLVWFVLFLDTGAALIEWRTRRNKKDEANS